MNVYENISLNKSVSYIMFGLTLDVKNKKALICRIFYATLYRILLIFKRNVYVYFPKDSSPWELSIKLLYFIKLKLPYYMQKYFIT